MPQNPPHTSVLLLTAIWLEQIYGRLFVRSQFAVEVADSDRKTNYPEPDIAVTTRPLLDFVTRHPNPDELYLVVEVADTTLSSDTHDKSALYARAGIVEYWIADVKKRRIIVHRDPHENGYNTIIAMEADAEIATQTRPEAKIRVGNLFPSVEIEEN